MRRQGSAKVAGGRPAAEAAPALPARSILAGTATAVGVLLTLSRKALGRRRLRMLTVAAASGGWIGVLRSGCAGVDADAGAGARGNSLGAGCSIAGAPLQASCHRRCLLRRESFRSRRWHPHESARAVGRSIARWRLCTLTRREGLPCAPFSSAMPATRWLRCSAQSQAPCCERSSHGSSMPPRRYRSAPLDRRRGSRRIPLRSCATRSPASSRCSRFCCKRHRARVPSGSGRSTARRDGCPRRARGSKTTLRLP
mmetsp:Transcript_22325/g.56982  ORF Transcript_22325/g.56982 Transcript_22325/m.56982 type:complete len:255 (-) Transcript_22325:447-1211(-)